MKALAVKHEQYSDLLLHPCITLLPWICVLSVYGDPVQLSAVYLVCFLVWRTRKPEEYGHSFKKYKRKIQFSENIL